MKILGHGVDIVDIEDFSKLFQDGREKHLVRYFSKKELEAVPVNENRMSRLATRFAVKEAVMKTLQHGFGDGLGFPDIEIEFKTNGALIPVLHGKALTLATKIGVREWWISTSDADSVSIASVIACG